MISPRTNRCTTVFVLALLCAAAWAGEPKEAPLPLEFELSPTPLGPFWPQVVGSPWYPLIFHRPPYAATVSLAGPTEFLPQPGTGRMGEFLDFAKEQAGLSTGQKTLLDAARGVYTMPGRAAVTPAGCPIVLGPMMDRSDPNSPERVVLYAVTLDDAKKMARAYFQFAKREFRLRVATAEKYVGIATENIESGEKRIAELDRQSATARQALEDFQKTVPYRTESEAHAAIGELDRMLNAAQVENAGIKAKMEAIQGYQRDSGRRAVDQATQERLDMMFVEESIALRGAQAREQMATRLREQANRFVDLKSTLTNAPAEKQTLIESLKPTRGELAAWQSRLKSAMQNEPQIPNKVVIYPVQWNEQAPGNK